MTVILANFADGIGEELPYREGSIGIADGELEPVKRGKQ